MQIGAASSTQQIVIFSLVSNGTHNSVITEWLVRGRNLRFGKQYKGVSENCNMFLGESFTNTAVEQGNHYLY